MFTWKNDQVLLWLKNNKYPDNVLESFRSHNITGITLPMLNSEELKEMGIENLRLRLEILNNISELIVEKDLSLGIYDSKHPILSELQTTIIATSLIKSISKGIVDETSIKLINKVKNDERDRNKDYHSLVSKINKLREEILPVLKDIQDTKPLPKPVDNKTIEPNNNTPKSKSTTPVQSPLRAEFLRKRSSTSDKIIPPPSSNINHSQSIQTPTENRRSSSRRSTHEQIENNSNDDPGNDTLRQLRAKTEDPCYKILQAAMRSHRLDRSEWRNYVLVICYGGDKERVLRYDEKPVVVFKELNELGLSPSLMLRQVEETDDTGDSHKFDDYETPGGRL